MSRSKVALIKGNTRSGNVRDALELIATGIDLTDKHRVLIKPNFVVTDRPLAATHIDAVRMILDFLRARYDGPITIAEGPSVQSAAEGFNRYGYQALAETYDATLMDLNLDEPFPVEVYDWRLRPLRLHLARTVVESDFRISVGPPKTHDVVIATLSLKNMIMGALISRFTHAHQAKKGNWLDFGAASKALWPLVPRWVRRTAPAEWMTFRVMSTLEPSDKMKMHQSYPVINLNLALLAPYVVPHLAVIDAFEAMEGNGPAEGTAVRLQLALASTDPLAADIVGTALMGFDADEIGYLHYCKRLGLGTGDLDTISIVGNATLEDCARPFLPHHAVDRQRRWRLPEAGRYLGPRAVTT